MKLSILEPLFLFQYSVQISVSHGVDCPINKQQQLTSYPYNYLAHIKTMGQHSKKNLNKVFKTYLTFVGGLEGNCFISLLSYSVKMRLNQSMQCIIGISFVPFHCLHYKRQNISGCLTNMLYHLVIITSSHLVRFATRFWSSVVEN